LQPFTTCRNRLNTHQNQAIALQFIHQCNANPGFTHIRIGTSYKNP
jgi:hypothetical protein